MSRTARQAAIPGETARTHPVPDGVHIAAPRRGEDIFSYLQRTAGGFSPEAYRGIIGAANDFKEGDRIVGVCAADASSRRRARLLLLNSRIAGIDRHPLFSDPLYDAITGGLDPEIRQRVGELTLRELRDSLLVQPESVIRPLLDGISSDLAACLVKVMTNRQLITVGRKIFNPLPGSTIGTRGYLGARIQPNSPTDHPDDIFWQVMSGFSYGIGDVVLGTNPVSSEPDSVLRVERCLLDIRRTFGIEEIIPHSVLAHIDIQAQVEQTAPGTTGIWFQSLAGNCDVNRIFDITLERMLEYSRQRTGTYGFYFETGQGADFTNGFSHGTDMVVHEARKYGFTRLLKQKVAEAQRQAGRDPAPWVHVNDVAGFIGPEVFRTREQLVRCCLEDIVMAKLQGMTIGLDVCTTLHMDVSLDDLEWCLDQIMPCCPAYLMALPTRMDPMLGYLSTSFQDHVRLQQRFKRRTSDTMVQFFQRLGVLDSRGKPAGHFGQPLMVWLNYCRLKGDRRPASEIFHDGRSRMSEVRQRGVPLAEGWGRHHWDPAPDMDREIRAVYRDAKNCIREELPADFIANLPQAVALASSSRNRDDYILHPRTGEVLSRTSLRTLKNFADTYAETWHVQFVISDGLNACSLTDQGNLLPYLEALRAELGRRGINAAPHLPVIRNGRVRAGYRIGELLFGGLPDTSAHRGIIHIIGERPGSMHHTFSAYLTAPPVATWALPDVTDHHLTRVVSGIAADALLPDRAAVITARIMGGLLSPPAGAPAIR